MDLIFGSRFFSTKKMDQSNAAEVVQGREVFQSEVIFESGKSFTVQENITPLMKAVIHNKLELIKLLLMNGADVNAATSSGNTAIHYGCFMNHDEAIRILIKYGADVNVSNICGQTPLLVCAERILRWVSCK